MGSASTKERSLTPPHANQHSSTTNVLRRGNVAGPSSSAGRLSSTLPSGGAGGSAAAASATGESLSPRGRPRHGVEASLFGLSIGRERDREAEREAREQRKAEKERERQKERERSLREESLDGGFLVTQGVYTGVEDFKEKIVRQLMIERRLAPFFKGLSDHEQNWTDAQLVAAVRGLPIPSANVQLETESPRLSSSKKQAGPSDPANGLIVTIPSRSRAQSTSEGINWSGSSAPSFGFSSRSRAKTLSITSPRNLQPQGMGSPVELNDSPKMVDGRPIEAVLYQNAVECPICFLYYPPYLNRTRCCDQEICSECFVQIKRPDPHLPEHHDDQPNTNAVDQLMSEPATCPFCVESEFGVIYTPPPFRRGLLYSAPSSSLSSPISGTPVSVSLPSPLPSPPGRRLALSVNSPEVVTTDRIRPDWSQKLAAARAHAARRAAAATALHTAAYLMPSPSPSTSNNLIPPPPSFASRRLIRRTPPIDQQQPPSPGSSTTANGPAAAAEAFFARRSRLVDIEEMMLLEAIRLSLADEEERRSRPQPSDDDEDGAGKGKSVDRSPQRGESSGSNTTDEGGSLEGLFNLRSLNEELEHDVSTTTTNATTTTTTNKGGSNKGKVVAR